MKGFEQALAVKQVSQNIISTICIDRNFRSFFGAGFWQLKVLWTFKKTFFKLLLIEKPVMRETECRKTHQKIRNSYQVMKVSKFD